MNGLGLFAIVFGITVILYLPLRRRPRRGPINLTLHRIDRK